MSEPHPGRESTRDATERDTDPIRYPLNHVVGLMDTPEQVRCALDTLTGPFLESEIKVVCGGEQEADRLRATTGRTGLLDHVLRIAQSIGITNDELEVKDRYEQALREGHVMVHVLAPTDERKERAAQGLRDCGGHFINFFGRFTREEIAP